MHQLLLNCPVNQTDQALLNRPVIQTDQALLNRPCLEGGLLAINDLLNSDVNGGAIPRSNSTWSLSSRDMDRLAKDRLRGRNCDTGATEDRLGDAGLVPSDLAMAAKITWIAATP